MITDRLRKHTSWVSSMNLQNELQDKTVDTLIEAVTSRYDLVNRYYHVKRQLLGLDNWKIMTVMPPFPLCRPKYRLEILQGNGTFLFAAFSPQWRKLPKCFLSAIGFTPRWHR